MSLSLSQLTHVFTRIGLMSFGGPAAQIAVMHKELVEDRDWLSEDQFLKALSFCMLLPGPEAMQLCTYAGWRLRGVIGGLIAGLLFVLPGAIFMFAIASVYALWGQIPVVEAIFLGIKATVIIVVIRALIKLARKTLKRPLHWAIAGAGFVALYVFAAPFPLVIACAAVLGSLVFRASDDGAPVPKHKGSWTTPLIWLVLWATPIVIAWAMGHQTLTDIGVFFSKLAVVSFGGAYAVLTYMTQAAVETQGWITPAQMMDGLGLAETTPGPLILVTQFVGFMTGYSLSGFGLAIAAGLMTLWATFVPCFLWIFTAAPHVEWLTHQPRLSGALKAITAAVVGVIANLSLWFAVHLFFDETVDLPSGFSATVPNLQSINVAAIALTILAAVLMRRVSLPVTLALMGAAGGLLGFAI